MRWGVPCTFRHRRLGPHPDEKERGGFPGQLVHKRGGRLVEQVSVVNGQHKTRAVASRSQRLGQLTKE